jgi:hypothetical protein
LRFLECFWSVNEDTFIFVRPIIAFHTGIFSRPLWRADHWLHPQAQQGASQRGGEVAHHLAADPTRVTVQPEGARSTILLLMP